MVATWKLKAVDKLADRMSKSKTVGLVSISRIPSSQFQQMRKNLKGRADLKVTKCSILKRACGKAGMEKFGEHVKGQVGIVFADVDAFQLSRIMKTTKTSAPAKPGSIAEKDIVIPAGDTPFKPGPIIGDLQKVGIKAKIQGGKIIVTDDSPVVKAGEAISADLANVLTRFGIHPVELGLTIKAACEDGMIYGGDVLDIDTEATLGKVREAYGLSMNLAYNAGIYNKETIKIFLREAFTKGMSLAINTEVVNKETIDILLAKANMQMQSLSAAVSGEAPAEDAQEKPAEAKEEATEEAKEEDAASGLASLFD
ncbi:MAG: 50S ribosomal protein L10 [Candidatus Altiarchaeota archaeon]|nr:50S ribosomal protein L10 [Candidatus Altiarchaeota archaeon]